MNLKRIIDKNLTGILTVTSILGTVTTGVLSYEAGSKIQDLEDDEKTVKNYVKILTPSVVSGAATVTCIAGLNYAHAKKYAALASLYTLSQVDLETTKEKIQDLFGEDGKKKVDDAVKEERRKRSDIIYVDGYREQLFFDRVTGRYFSSSVHKIDTACAKINAIISSEGRANLNEFYTLLDLEPVECGELIQWHRGDVYDALEISYDTQMTKDYQAVMTIEYDVTNYYSW